MDIKTLLLLAMPLLATPVLAEKPDAAETGKITKEQAAGTSKEQADETAGSVEGKKAEHGKGHHYGHDQDSKP